MTRAMNIMKYGKICKDVTGDDAPTPTEREE